MLHKLHRVSALVIGTFVLFHLINHAMIFAGVQAHIEFMDSLRVVYRNIALESVLLFFVIFQVVSGVRFVWKRKGQRVGFMEKAQAISGLYLGYFLLNHVGAVLFGRFVAELDTNVYYGIAGFHINPFYWYFVPYYFLAIVAIFVHIAAAFHWLGREKLTALTRTRAAYVIMLGGILLSASLMMGFAGMFSEIKIPAEYQAIYN